MNQILSTSALSLDINAKALKKLSRLSLAPGTKGLLPRQCPIALGEIGTKGWNVLAGDVGLPAALLRMSAIENNSRTMQRYMAEKGMSLAPHGKTSMAPQLFSRQMADGAWGLTISNVQHLAIALAYGFRRLIIANQIVGAGEIAELARLLAETPNAETYIFVDSVESVDRLVTYGGANAGALPACLIEIGYDGGRAGCRTIEKALDVAEAVRRNNLRLRGIAGFEGLLSDVDLVDAFLDRICTVASRCEDKNLFDPDAEIILSAGGSAYYDRLKVRLATNDPVARRTRIVARSGCYLTHDSGTYAKAFTAVCQRDSALHAGGFVPALLLAGEVLSRPEPKKAIVGLGRRDCGTDADLPIPLMQFRPGRDHEPRPIGPGYRFSGINDQHGHIEVPENSPLAVGDLVIFGISHPCTTFDKWQVLLAIDEDWTVIDAIKTFF